MRRDKHADESRWPSSVIVALIFGLILRLGTVAFVAWDDLPDARSYDNYAWNLAQGEGYRDDLGQLARRPPAYPLFLMGIYTLVGRYLQVAQIVQAAISASLVLGFYALGRRLASKQVGVLSAWIWACYPTAIYFSAVLISETVFVALTLGLLLVMTREDRTAWGQGSLVGAFLGLLTLTRPVALLFLPVVAYVWWIQQDYKQVFRRFVPMILILTVCIGVWGYRNMIVLGSFVPLTTHGGYDLWVSNHPQADGRGVYPELQGDAARVMQEIPGELTRDRYYYREFLRILKEDPWRVIALIPKKLWWFWKPWPETVSWQKVLGGLTESILLVGLAIGAYWGWQYREVRLLHFLVLVTTIFYGVLAYGSLRFRFGVSPAIVLLSAIGLSRTILWRP